MAEPEESPADVAGDPEFTSPAPDATAGPARVAGLRERARRAGLAGCAALLLGTTALGVGAAQPSPVKAPLVGGYVEGSLVLEADPDAVAEHAPEARGGMTVVSRSAATVKTAHADPFVAPDPDAPVCASYPVAPGKYRLTSPYGYPVHPIFGTYSMHMGNDYAAPLGTPIPAVTDGTVVYTGAGRLGRSSELVIIEHTVADTTFYSWYVHMYPDGIFVDVGDRVRAGDVIAEVGNNGNSTGPHLHFEIHTTDAGLGLQKNPVGRSTVSLRSATPGLTEDPTDEATDKPTDEPTDKPTGEPTEDPTDKPTGEPTEDPTDKPTGEPTEEPTDAPADQPTDAPTDEPAGQPTDDAADRAAAGATAGATGRPTGAPAHAAPG